MYENIKNVLKDKYGDEEHLKIQITVCLDWRTEIKTIVRNNPVKIFDFFKEEKIELEETKMFNLKKRKGKKFLNFLKGLELTDIQLLNEIMKDRKFDSVYVGYAYDRWVMRG